MPSIPGLIPGPAGTMAVRKIDPGNLEIKQTITEAEPPFNENNEEQ